MASPSSTDALGLLSAALSARTPDAESKALSELYSVLKSQPGNIPILLPSLVGLLSRAGPSLKSWIAEVIDLTFCRPILSPDAKHALSVHLPEALLTLLREGDRKLSKIAVQTFASAYPSLFRIACQDRSKQALWKSTEAVRAQVVRLFDSGSPGVRIAAIKCFQRIIQVHSRGAGDPRASQAKADANLSLVPPWHAYISVGQLEEEGNRLLKQIVTLVFTSSSPDLVMATLNAMAALAKTRPQLSNIVLEALASWTPAALASLSHTQVRNVEKTVRILYFHFLRNNLAGAHSAALQKALQTQKKRMEDAAREYIERKEAEAKRKRDTIADELNQSKRIKTELGASFAQPGSVQAVGGAEAFRDASVRGNGDATANPLASFDVTTLPVPLVVELIIAQMQALTDVDLQAAIARIRDNLGAGGFPQINTGPGPAPGPPPPPPPQQQQQQQQQHPRPPGAPPPPPPSHMFGTAPQPTQIKTETGLASDVGPGLDQQDEAEEEAVVQDPLKMDVGEDEELADLVSPPRSPEAEAQDEQDIDDMALVALDNFVLAPPEYLTPQESDLLIKDAVAKIRDIGHEASLAGVVAKADGGGAGRGTEMQNALWATLIVRLATRGLAEQTSEGADAEASPSGSEQRQLDLSGKTLTSHADAIRAMMLDFIHGDFANRVGFAISWLAEEWHCDRIRRRRGQPEQYSRWLERIMDVWVPQIDGKDRSLAAFLSDLPEIPRSVIDKVAKLCRDKNRMATGMSTLQDIWLTRPPVRKEAGDRLLQMTRSPDKTMRARAIISAKQSSGQSVALEAAVLAFARDSLDVLKAAPPPTAPGSDSATGDKANDAQNGVDATAPTVQEAGKGTGPEKDGEKEGPAADDEEAAAPGYPQDGDDVLRFVELPLSLCTKVPDMLDEIFAAYPKMPMFIQVAIHKHIVNLIRALGPNNARLLTLLRNFPEGADSLALCIFKILTEKSRTPALVSLVKELVDERDVDPRFLVPIMPDLDKNEIMKKLPKVVTILSSKAPEDRALVKSVFQSIVTTPPQGFGSVSTNLPRVRQTELLTPVELMGLLHRSEKEIGLKNTGAAIQICFSMTDVFRSEVLGAVLNQILEEPTLPVIFMRTVILAVSTYKSLSGYVSKNLLSRLITKKIWQNPPLWDGFIICAKLTAPSSFGALIQLPKEQLREVVGRQPELKTGLKEYLTKKAGGNRARLTAFMDLLGGDDAPTAAAAAAAEGGAATAATPEAAATTSNASPSAAATPTPTPAPAAANEGSAPPPPPSPAVPSTTFEA
ncbi:uncharacterized protein PFL1_03773 [Pseudozyma flocculosa PF-1]|uniref:Related to Symplekin n=2 Tax=Pseudozyma flocculosa TaxID=84751 RepID=A0A5C3EVW5_9BASI|nr:uncharacterized protein PFL1_03773 [Pseudozyma flocculosa PF-1]EPQ28470.1 hypothetical protein PFL1_03773 [Pseudozyma flocculosa PF-1]SPO36388.1 related to Symplekin [Pseudozyma flocculosa]